MIQSIIYSETMKTKHLVALFTLSLVALTSGSKTHAQTVNGINVNELNDQSGLLHRRPRVQDNSGEFFRQLEQKQQRWVEQERRHRQQEEIRATTPHYKLPFHSAYRPTYKPDLRLAGIALSKPLPVPGGKKYEPIKTVTSDGRKIPPSVIENEKRRRQLEGKEFILHYGALSAMNIPAQANTAARLAPDYEKRGMCRETIKLANRYFALSKEYSIKKQFDTLAFRSAVSSCIFAQLDSMESEADKKKYFHAAYALAGVPGGIPAWGTPNEDFMNRGNLINYMKQKYFLEKYGIKNRYF